MANMDESVRDAIRRHGIRNALLTSIAPTGTISLYAGNVSSGIEPVFAYAYTRKILQKDGSRTEEEVEDYALRLWRQMHGDAPLPEHFVDAQTLAPMDHVKMQAAAQKWVDSSISKTANVPTDYPYEQFKDIYLYAYEQGLKGCTTFRFNPEAFQGVLVKEKDLENTTYVFTLDDGSKLEVKGNEEIEYDGEVHTAANLYDALKEGYYGKF